MLCLTLTGSTLEENRALVERNRKWISIAELRLDYLHPDEQKIASSFPSTVDLPVILTLRRSSDGGMCMLAEKQRLQLLYETAKGDFAYVDIEEDVKKTDLKFKDPLFEQKVDLEQSLRQRTIKIIRSYHNFECVPADIYGRISKLAARGDIPKVAVTPTSMMDVITLFRVEQELGNIKEKIVIGMGDYGVCTRILYKKCGSMLSFCSDSQAAPGHLGAQTMSELYRADKLDGNTHIFGIIGNPVYHTASPKIHNPGFEAIRYNAVYVPFLVDSVRAFFKLAEMLQIHGFSVTVPHKRSVQPYLGRITREVKQIGSCNTVVRIQNMWKGINTDYYGFLAPISEPLGKGEIKNALVVGAGGAARAVVWALHNHGVKVTILNRSLEHARTLASETMSSFDTLENAHLYNGGFELVVQTTSVGMGNNGNEESIPSFSFSGREIAYDLVYNPRETRFLKRAMEAGCTIIGGSQMLMEQGKLQFEAFTGYHYPHWIQADI
ncbi:Shikimate dehydrogenase (NADP(+)) [bioreactor metagenome]|uniref:shikimate dehydrogenase (NADP(+)) n=1 Tax=bioreactor metagenome TaxID=1076179 RepID=A0A644WTE7_9ZZZZ